MSEIWMVLRENRRQARRRVLPIRQAHQAGAAPPVSRLHLVRHRVELKRPLSKPRPHADGTCCSTRGATNFLLQLNVLRHIECFPAFLAVLLGQEPAAPGIIAGCHRPTALGLAPGASSCPGRCPRRVGARHSETPIVYS